MTTDEMVAGPELDALLAARVFGIKALHYPNHPDFPYYIPSGKPWRTHSLDSRPLPAFSTDPGAAWAVVEKLGERACCLNIDCVSSTQVRYEVRIDMVGSEHGRTIHAIADTMPLAVCRAAIEAVGADTVPAPFAPSRTVSPGPS